jgi:purine-binding chemotaxis protein CheW
MKKETQALLKSRAIAMAVEPDRKRETSGIIEMVEFILGSESYGIQSEFVREVYPLKDFTPLPGVPSFVVGIVNIRGQLIPIVDLKKFFNLTEKGLGELNKLIIIRNENMEFGILADTVNGTKQIYMEDILPVPGTITAIGEDYLKGVTTDNLIIISAEKLLSDKTIVINEEVS